MRLLLLATLLIGTQLSARNGAVSGRILFPDGTPAANIRVAAISLTDRASANQEALFALAQSDRDGAYRLNDLPTGRYGILAGPLERPVYFPGVARLEDATVVALTDGKTLEGLDFKLGVRVSGRLPGSNAIAIQAQVPYRLMTPIKSDGSFSFPAAPGGSYVVYVDATPRGRVVIAQQDFELTLASLTPIDPKEITGEFVRVPPGEVRLKCSASGCVAGNDQPVTIIGAFEIGARHITQLQWELVMGGSTAPFPRPSRLSNPDDLKGSDRPVVGARKQGAEAFCERLTARNDGYRYRLPAEIQYEYAIRGGTSDPPSDRGNANHDSNLWNEAYLNRPRQPNALGIYDTTIWEWIREEAASGSAVFPGFLIRAGLSRGRAGADDQTIIMAFRCVREPAPSQP